MVRENQQNIWVNTGVKKRVGCRLEVSVEYFAYGHHKALNLSGKPVFYARNIS